MALTKITNDGVDFSGTTDINIDSGTFVVDASTNRVGIGNTSPSAPLHVSGNMYAGASIVSTNDTTGLNWYNNLGLLRIQQDTSNTGYCFDVYKGGTNAVKIGFKSDGSAYFANNVGIGTSSPAADLHVIGNNIVQYVEATGTAAEICFRNNTSTGDNIRIGGSGNNLTFDTGGSESARIDQSGNVGIGTTSPSTKLDVSGNVQFGDGGGFDMNINGTRHQFSIGGSEKMRLDSSGRLGIGTTTPSSYTSAGNKLVVANTTGSTGLTIASGTTSSGGIYFADGTTGNDTYRGYVEFDHYSEFMRFGTAAAEKVRIDSSGRLLVGTTSGTESVEVSGAIASVGTSSSFSSGAKRAFFDYNGSANRARIGVTSGANNAAQAISFHTSPSGSAPGSVERFRIGEVGQLGIGGATYGTSGQVLTSNGSSSAPSWQDASGGVAQVKSATKTDTFSTTSTHTWVDVTGLSISITPSSTSSKILVLWNIDIYSGGGPMSMRIERGGTGICVATSTGSRTPATKTATGSQSNNRTGHAAGSFLDSPSTTSSTTYNIAIRAGAGTSYVNRTEEDNNNQYTFRGTSTITVMEVS